MMTVVSEKELGGLYVHTFPFGVYLCVYKYMNILNINPRINQVRRWIFVAVKCTYEEHVINI